MPITNVPQQINLNDYHPQTHADLTATVVKIFESRKSATDLLDHVHKVQTNKKVAALSPGLGANAAKWLVSGEDPEADHSNVEVQATTVPLQVIYTPVTVSVSWLEDDTDGAFMTWFEKELVKHTRQLISGSIINGNGRQQLVGILSKDSRVKEEQIELEHLLDGLLKLLSNVDNTYQPVWLMNREIFGRILTLGDANGRVFIPHLVGSVDGYKLFGHNVIVTENVPDNTVIFGDLSCYTVFYNSFESSKIRKIEKVDSTKFVYRVRVGGLVTDPHGFVVGRIVDTLAGRAASSRRAASAGSSHAAASGSI